MHPPELRERAITMHRDGVPLKLIWQTLGLSQHTIKSWLYGESARRIREQAPRRRCPRCSDPPRPFDHPGTYAYLLGLYLGDGYLVTRARIPVLRIFCTAVYPNLIDLCEAAMRAVAANSVQRIHRQGDVVVQSYSKHWPCLFPQHGPGRKHERPIELADWQEPIVDAHAGDFARGLFHSDGCRITNRVTVSGRTYSYPRYLFDNESVDIMHLCGRSLDRLGIEWRMSRRNTLSVAKRAAVARLDEFVGPKS
jgi:hypothetical protein